MLFRSWLTATPDGLIVHACRAAGFEPRVAYLLDDPLAINNFIAANLAVTLTSELLAPHFRDVAVLPVTGDPAGYELASGGVLSAHADFVNAWKPGALRKLVDGCLNALVHCGRGL